MARIDDAFWRDAIKVYHERLSAKYSDAVITKAFDKAIGEYKQWFPNLGQLIELCEYFHKNERAAAPPDRQLPSGQNEPWSGNGADIARKIVSELSEKKEMRNG